MTQFTIQHTNTQRLESKQSLTFLIIDDIFCTLKNFNWDKNLHIQRGFQKYSKLTTISHIQTSTINISRNLNAYINAPFLIST